MKLHNGSFFRKWGRVLRNWRVGISQMVLVFRIFSLRNISENEFSDINTYTDLGQVSTGRLRSVH